MFGVIERVSIGPVSMTPVSTRPVSTRPVLSATRWRRSAMGSLLALYAAMGTSLGCTNYSRVPHVETNSERALALPTSAVSSLMPADGALLSSGAQASGPEPLAPENDWRAAARAGDMARVRDLLDRLPEAEQLHPEARYARAVANQRLGQCEVALDALNDLESALPLLSEDIQQARAACQLEVGPFDQAAQYFARQTSAENQLLGVRALLRADQPRRALVALEGVMSRIERQGKARAGGRRGEAEARALRATLLERLAQNRIAERDYLWLATVAPTHASALGADEAYERISKRKLSRAQRFERADAFSEQGQVKRTERELDLLGRAPGSSPARDVLVSTLAWAHYNARTDYLKAAELFRKAAAVSKLDRPRMLFYAARALSRTHQDEQAISAYAELAQSFPASGYAESARFLIARLNYGLARWERASNAYGDYLKVYSRGRGRFVATSRYERAISQLANNQSDLALAELIALADAEPRSDRRALLLHLKAVALQGSLSPESRGQAGAAFREVIAEYPLSFAALASAARLARESEVSPPLAPVPALGLMPLAQPAAAPELLSMIASEPLKPRLPPKAALLAELGLNTEAERALYAEKEDVRRQYSTRADEALCELYGALDRGQRRFALGSSLLTQGSLRRSGDPAMWAWNCAYPRPYQSLVQAAERRNGLPSGILYAVMRQESGFRPDAVSPVGARGLMQLMPNTARRAAEQSALPLGEDLTNPQQNIELGAFYLSQLVSMLGGQVPLALAAYNAGPAAVGRWLRGADQLPLDLWIARIPYDETRLYVGRVLSNWLAYRSLANDTNVDLPRLVLASPGNTRPSPDAY